MIIGSFAKSLKGMFCFVAAALISFSMLGCGSSDTLTSEEVDEILQEHASDDSPKWLTFDEMLASPQGTFVERDGMYLCLIGSDGIASGVHRWHEGECYYRKSSTSNVPFETMFVFEQGDRIVSTEEDFGISFMLIEAEGYCSFEPEGYDNNVFDTYSNFDDYELGEGKALDEIAGVDLGPVSSEERSNIAKSALESEGVLISAEGVYYTLERTKVTGGYYEGTQWVEEGISFNTPYIDIKHPSELILAEKTKDGYFIFDFLSTVEPGEYLMSPTGDKAYKVEVQ